MRALKLIVVIATVAVLAAGVYLKWWVIFGQVGVNEPCSGRGGCKTFWCLSHERRGQEDVPSAGYCTDKCTDDRDCEKSGLRCVVPTQAALDDLARFGRPQKLCMRVH
jgi:hypothetical protein